MPQPLQEFLPSLSDESLDGESGSEDVDANLHGHPPGARADQKTGKRLGFHQVLQL